VKGPSEHLDRLGRTRLLVCDVDGTLTDGAMYYGSDGEVLKRFTTRDGLGISRLLDAGVVVALVTSEDSPIVTARAKKLRVEHVVLGCLDKAVAVQDLCQRLKVTPADVTAIGDDLGDLAAFRVAGLSVAVAAAVPEVKAAAHLVCESNGGHGAVRELSDGILASQ